MVKIVSLEYFAKNEIPMMIIRISYGKKWVESYGIEEDVIWKLDDKSLLSLVHADMYCGEAAKTLAFLQTAS